MKNLILLICTLILCMFTNKLSAQSLKAKYLDLRNDSRVKEIKVNSKTGVPSEIFLSSSTIDINPSIDIKKLLKIDGLSDIKYSKTNKLSKRLSVDRYQQYYNGLKVEFGNYLSINDNDVPRVYRGNYFDIEASKLNTSPTLNEQEALDKALALFNSELYLWDQLGQYLRSLGPISPERAKAINKSYLEHYPTGELLLVDNIYTEEVDVDLAYKFNIYSVNPNRRDYVYVNAHNGEIMVVDPIIKHATTATVDTRYSGTKEMQVMKVGMEYAAGASTTPEPNPFKDATLMPDELLNSTTDMQTSFFLVLPTPPDTVHVLIDTTRSNGLGTSIETYDCNGVGGDPLGATPIYGQARSFTDIDNDWTVSEHVRGVPGDFSTEKNNDDVAFDAHWGAGVVYDYWLDNHGRKSYDDAGADILSYVHIGVGYDNAFWNGQAMSYGDGMSFAPLTSLDVCGHEIGHAVCSSTSNLVYALESGAMNEGFSDIWAACVEYYAVQNIDPNLATQSNPQIPFGIGEQVASPGEALRWMDNPKVENNPDTHGGEFWQDVVGCDPDLTNDQCGVHGNSGVLNKWFYLMTVGSGTGSGPNAGYAGTGANQDDEINDNGDTYSVTGLGFDISEQIAFGTEVILSATATFEEARTATITYISLEYGVCSPEMESALNAWHAVGVGEVFVCDAVNGFFSDESKVLELGDNINCLAKKTHSVPVSIIGDVSNEPVTISGGTAEESIDFELITTSITGSGTFFIEIDIFDDAYIELDETIEISVSGLTHTITIVDNDIVPLIGGQTINLINHTFTTSDNSSTDWTLFDAYPNTQINEWYFDENIGGAFVSFNGASPTYDGNNGDELIYLISPEIDATGLKDITFTTNIQFGGEVDSDGVTPLDYGALVYTFDGVTFTEFPGQRYGSAAQESANPDFVLDSSFDDKVFKIAFMWYNDPLVNGAYSFSVSDILMTAKTKSVETDISNSQNKLNADEGAVYFFSDDGSDMIVKIDNISEDISCVDVNVVASGNGRTQVFQGFRSNKVIEVSGMPEDATYDMTVYYTAQELSNGDWVTSRPSLNILKVEDTDIDNLSSGFTVIENPGYNVGPGSTHFEYTGSFTGNGVFAITDLVGIDIAIKVNLQGPYNTSQSLMNDQLRSKNLIPIHEPYTNYDAFDHVGEGSNLKVDDILVFDAALDGDDVIDWVFVELRTTSDVVVTTQSGLLQRDGDVVSIDNLSPLRFYGASEDDYHIVVRHRNHLGLKSMLPVSLSSVSTTSYDFTTGAGQATGSQQVELESGVWGMYSGNTNGDEVSTSAHRQIRMSGPASINDYTELLDRLGFNPSTIVLDVYEPEDLSMDGNVRMSGPASINDYTKLLQSLGFNPSTILIRSF